MTRRAVVISALGKGSGCALRARYAAEALQRAGWQVDFWVPPRNLPWSLETLFWLPWYCFKVLARQMPVQLALGIKPYPNTWFPLWRFSLQGAVAVQDVDDLDGEYRGGFIGWAVGILQAPAFRLLHWFSTHHPGIKRALEEKKHIPDTHIISLGQGVDLARFSPAAAFIRKPGPRRLAMAAHLNVACELEILMDWIGGHFEKLNLQLDVLGGGPDENRFRTMVIQRGLEGRIRFSGALEPLEIAARLAEAELCLAPYRSGRANAYRVPMKVGEYLAVGRKVLSTDLPGLGALRPFVYIAPANKHGFVVALKNALSASDMRTALGGEYVRKNLGWDNVIRSFLTELSLN